MTIYLTRYVRCLVYSRRTDLLQLRVDVLETDSLPEVYPYLPGTPLLNPSAVALPYPIRLSAAQKLNYYTDRQGFNLLAMFKNPMMMMMLLGGGLVFAMPYIMVRPLSCPIFPAILMEKCRKILTLRSYKISRNVKRKLAAFKVHSTAAT